MSAVTPWAAASTAKPIACAGVPAETPATTGTRTSTAATIAALGGAEAAGLAHRAGADDPVDAGVEESADVGLQRRRVDASGRVERGRDGGKDACEAHALP